MLFGMIVVMGLFEMIGVASIMPFIAVLGNPDIVETNYYLSRVYQALGFADKNDFLVFLGTTTFVIVVGSLTFKAVTQWVMARYVQMRNYSLGSRLLRRYLSRPYSFFLNRHSADLGKRVLSEVSQVINGCLSPAVDLVANTVVATFLISLVVLANPVVAVSAVLVLGGAYAVIYTVLRKRLSSMGRQRLKANQQRFQIIQEAFGGIKDVKVLGIEEGYIQGFRRPAYRFAKVKADAQVISGIPRFALQALVFGGMILILLSVLVRENTGLNNILPLIVLYAAATSRLIPALQAIYKSLISLRFSKPALDMLYSDFYETEPGGAPRPEGDRDEVAPLPLDNELRMENICYTYPLARKQALTDITLRIDAKTTVGFVGSTGAGKTTVVDIILGLLEPQQGRMLIDGNVVGGERLARWQRNIGYVPQHIYLTDDTVAANIAFGVNPKEIDHEAVERAARVAELHGFVTEEMPDGYATLVGERGVRLSGGQRQRIGIARALYRDPDVLVLDEATSALDTVTERAVMHAVHNLGRKKTIIIIAHRLSTVEACHNIFLLDKGRLVAQGTYQELLVTDERFEAMAVGQAEKSG